MTSTFDRKTSTYQIFIIIGFLIIFYEIYSLSISLYRDTQLENHIRQFEMENTRLEKEEKEKERKYWSTILSSFQEKSLKQNLNRVYPGEETIIIEEERQLNPLFEERNTGQTFSNFLYKKILTLPYYQQWFYFFWGGGI